ncbi:putative translin-associated factor TraX [Stipitochalara longipes BDJ]|nr:putative translin-associated factor TraX [Stipitochalara longipes BDJ]
MSTSVPQRGPTSGVQSMSGEKSQMPAVKRHHDGAEKEKEVTASPFMPMFEVFRDELDEHHDRRERIIKASRDITAASKKIIFSLQRVRALNSDIPPKIASEIKDRSAGMQVQFGSIAADLTGINAWRYQRQISPGIQEFMEAISFEHYLRTQKLITLEEASKALPAGVDLTGDDYVLGIFDLVGELMRFAITTMATTGTLPGSKSGENPAEECDILMDLRVLRTSFEALDTSSCGATGLGKDVQKKMEVMKTCVEKVETAVYGMIIRGRERPKGWVPDLADDRAPPVESY